MKKMISRRNFMKVCAIAGSATATTACNASAAGQIAIFDWLRRKPSVSADTTDFSKYQAEAPGEGPAGRDVLGEFAPKFAQLNDDVLFGEVWSRESELSARDRSLITVTALMAQGLTDTSFGHHLQMAKENGITRSEIAEILTHAAFYAGWPKAWAAFRMAKDIWADAENTDEKQLHQNSMVFPIGAPNDGFAQYFSGQSYLAPVSTEQVKIFNVTFEPGCRNNWHIHEADKGGGQILVCVAGRGYYQEWGKEPQELHPGDVINIMPGVKHWHGAAPDSWFSHLAVEVPGENCRSQWCEPVSEEEYGGMATNKNEATKLGKNI